MAAKSCGSDAVTGTAWAWSAGTCPGRCKPLHSIVSSGLPTTFCKGPLQRPGEAGLILLVARPPVKVIESWIECKGVEVRHIIALSIGGRCVNVSQAKDQA